MTSIIFVPIQLLYFYPKSRPGVLGECLSLGKKSFSEEPLNDKNSAPAGPRDWRTPDLTPAPPFCCSGDIGGPHTGSKPPEFLPFTSLPAGVLCVARERSPMSRLLVLLTASILPGWPAPGQRGCRYLQLCIACCWPGQLHCSMERILNPWM